MKFYRLFILNGQGRIATVAREVHATSDEDALAQAGATVGKASFELWDRARRIVTAEHSELDPNPLENGVGTLPAQ